MLKQPAYKLKRVSGKILRNKQLAPSRFNKAHLLVLFLIFAVIGGITIFSSFAAGPFASIEPENAAVTAPAVVVNDVNASAGKAVQFSGSTSSNSCPLPKYPNADCTGIPAGWTPKHTTNGNLTINTPGTVLDGELITGNLDINAPNVTVRNSWIYSAVSSCSSGFVLEDSDIGHPSRPSSAGPAIGYTGYTLRRVHIHDIHEGPRVSRCDTGLPVTIEDSFIDIIRGDCDHNDGIQGYNEPPRTILRHNTVDTSKAPGCTTAAIFVGNDGTTTRITVQDNLLSGGGYTLRLGPAPATYDYITGNRIINNSWAYNPALIENCSGAVYSDNTVVTIDSNYNITSTIRVLNNC